MGAERRKSSDRSLLVTGGGDATAVQAENLPFATFQAAERLAFGSGEPILDHVVRVVQIFLDIIPRSGDELLASHVK